MTHSTAHLLLGVIHVLGGTIAFLSGHGAEGLVAYSAAGVYLRLGVEGW